jgi:hypothetical protein
MIDLAEQLDRVARRVRREQQAMTAMATELALRTQSGNVRAVAVDAVRGSVVLVVDDLLVRVAVRRPAQALDLQRMHRAAPTELSGGLVMGDGRVVLEFSDGERTLPVVGEALILLG